MDSMLFKIGFDPFYLIVVILILVIATLILSIITFLKYARLKNKYNIFMKGNDGRTLEESMIDRYNKLEYLLEVTKENEKQISEIKKHCKSAYQKIGIVKYDAFHEMGGKLSFALTMLDDRNNGWLINAMHSREGCYTYVKEIVKGESYIELSEEELESLQRAKYQSAYEIEIKNK